jgi:hypothetical protein
MASSQIARTSAIARATASRASVPFVVATVVLMSAMCRSFSYRGRPSESEMTVVTLSIPNTFVTRTAMIVAAHWTGPNPPPGASPWKATTARPVPSANVATLKASLIAGWRRWTKRAAPPARAWARTTSPGDAKKRPITSGISLRENECAPRRK